MAEVPEEEERRCGGGGGVGEGRAPCLVQCGASDAHDELRLVRPWRCGRRSGPAVIPPKTIHTPDTLRTIASLESPTCWRSSERHL